VRIGAFRCAVGHPRFEDSGPAQTYCFVFPRTAVEIEHEHECAFAANPNVVTFYNRGQSYRRRAISSDGDRCDWFAVSADIARDAIRAYDPAVDDRPESPFRLTRGWSDPGTYLLQRRLFQRVSKGQAGDPLEVEEQVVLLLDRVLGSSFRRAGAKPVDGVNPGQREAIHQVEVLLSERWDQALSLRDLAAEVEIPVFSLCRLFRRVTGTSMHQYRRYLRIQTALEQVSESRRPLIDIAIDAGFSSHSHFTAAFHREFGRSPSELRSSRSAAPARF
jgi:AraC family transcriptional regulator